MYACHASVALCVCVCYVMRALACGRVAAKIGLTLKTKSYARGLGWRTVGVHSLVGARVLRYVGNVSFVVLARTGSALIIAYRLARIRIGGAHERA